jgi:hypothetical protein
MKKNYFFAVALFLPLLFCQQLNSPSPTPDTDQPGYFSLTQLQGLQKTATITADTNTINLGDLHSTTNYYFLLTNCGGHIITNINLSVSDSSFAIFPTSIDSLTVGLGTQALVPIIKLTAIHGTGAQGLGSEPLMSQGVHQVHINITGATKHNNIDTNTSLTAAATINALIMDVDIHTITKTIDLSSKPTSSPFALFRFDGFYVSNMPGYVTNDTTDSIATITNKGNVNLIIKTISLVYGTSDSIVDSASYTIGINDSANFTLPRDISLLFSIDGNNTVCDPNKMQLQTNGKSYFYMAVFGG